MCHESYKIRDVLVPLVPKAIKKFYLKIVLFKKKIFFCKKITTNVFYFIFSSKKIFLYIQKILQIVPVSGIEPVTPGVVVKRSTNYTKVV